MTPSDPLERLIRELPERFLPRRKYLVGLSGGLDSCVLLDTLVRAGFRRLVVCHFNHTLRGRASGHDAAFARRLAEKQGFQFRTDKADVRKLAADASESTETAARRARLAFFGRIARHERCPRVFLAHHAEDQAETVLFSVLRGAGLAGLAGMRPESTITMPTGEITLLRPMLGIRRADLAAAAKLRRLRFRTDASNADLSATRNRLRHDSLPALNRVMERDVVAALCRLADIAAAENDVIEELASAALDSSRAPGAGNALLTAPLLAQPVAVQRRAIRTWLTELGVPNLTFDLVERIRAAASPDAASSRTNLPAGGQIRRRAGVLDRRTP